MSKNYTFDLSDLSLSGGTHAITTIAKAAGYLDSNPSNSVSYTVASSFQVRVTGSWDANGDIIFYDGISSSGTFLYRANPNYDYDGSFDQTLEVTSGFLHVWLQDSGGGSFGTPSAGITFDSSTNVYTVTANGTITGFESYGCIVEGTPITLANGSFKNIEDITFDDDLLVWNFYEGKFDSAKPLYILQPRQAQKYNCLFFNDGTVLKLVGNGGSRGYHRIYNLERETFTHSGVDETPIGTHTFSQNGMILELISQRIIEEPVRYYNIITDKHYNLFANGILTSCKLSNRYKINNMVYDTNTELLDQTFVDQYLEKLIGKGFMKSPFI